MTAHPSFCIETATESDVAGITAVRAAAAEDLTNRYGQGHWSAIASDRSVRHGLITSRLLVARDNSRIIGTLRLSTKKPWAIDVTYFAAVTRPLYLIDMAVDPAVQRQGVGRRLLDEATSIARAWPAESIRLDAYDAPAGAGDFYRKCGFRDVGSVVYRSVPLLYFELIL